MAAVSYPDNKRAPMTYSEYERDLAQAVAAERERCAKLAERHVIPVSQFSIPSLRTESALAARIAAEIRKSL